MTVPALNWETTHPESEIDESSQSDIAELLVQNCGPDDG
jgi:hypothetical protein